MRRFFAVIDELSEIAYLNLPFASGEVHIAFTDDEPADSPAIVILSGSPPNFSMFALTQSRALS